MSRKVGEKSSTYTQHLIHTLHFLGTGKYFNQASVWVMRMLKVPPFLFIPLLVTPWFSAIRAGCSFDVYAKQQTDSEYIDSLSYSWHGIAVRQKYEHNQHSLIISFCSMGLRTIQQ